jgi:uncharacterized membrane protein required for colicin V production
MIGPLTLLDAGLIAVALISGLLAMYRGLTRELLSIVSWLLAAAAAALHYLMLAKTLTLEPLLYAGAVFGLLAVRAIPRRPRNPARA